MEKRVLVTGASSGIGEAVCRYLSQQGYFVVLVARNEDRLNQISNSLPNGSVVIPYDLNNLEEIEHIFIEATRDGKLVGLVHSAGINRDVPIRANDVEEMVNVTAVNYSSFVELGKYFNKKKYSEDGAAIVAISSLASKACAKGMCTYAASKAALNAAVKVMAREFMKRKQRVNAILPAFVNTAMMQDAIEKIGELNVSQPLGIIEPIDIAYMVEYLLSDKARFITGAEFTINGGSI